MNYNQVLYHIYPLGFTDAPKQNDGIITPRINKVLDWIPHLEKLGVTSILFGPVFESSTHGYDTIDYSKIDCRLGTNHDFEVLCNVLHQKGFSVILDGVFNHVGRDFVQFKDVLEKKQDSKYKDWFYIDFNNNQNEDGFTYADWEGHHELVKLNLDNQVVRGYLLDRVVEWINVYKIDGLRLDVAYCLNRTFMKELRSTVKQINPNFFLLGEMIGGDYNTLLQPDLLDSVTNYECRKGLYSSMNTHNLFEIGHSLHRQFGNDPWCLYRHKHLLSFVDNHDVDRLASVLNDPRDIKLTYALMFAMPGIPCIYYGSEWGAKGTRTNQCDYDLRPSFDEPVWNELTDYIHDLIHIRLMNRAFVDGNYEQLYLQNEQFAFTRRDDNSQITFVINISDQPCHIHFNNPIKLGVNLSLNDHENFEDGVDIPAKSCKCFSLSWD